MALIGDGDLADRSVTNAVGGASPGTSRTNGTMALNSESWGIGQTGTAIANGTYTFDLNWFVPIAFAPTTLVGALIAQTAATDLTCELGWATSSDLFTLTGTATATVACSYSVQTV